MKFLVGLVIVGGIAGVLLWQGLGSYDPTQEGRDAKKAIGPGMTWQQVIDTAGEPKRYQVVVMKIEKLFGEEREVFKALPPNEFDRKRLMERMGANELEYGFVFPYRFSEKVAFAVWFDGTGTVQRVDDLITMADLLDSRDD